MDNKNSKAKWYGCLLLAILVVIWGMEGFLKWFMVICLVLVVLNIDKLKFQEKKKVVENENLNPNFEIKYKDSDGSVTLRKVFVREFDGKVLNAYCFLRNENRTFYIPRIIECIDLETGEVLSKGGNGDLRLYFNEKLKTNYKPSDMMNYNEWNKISFSTHRSFVDGISGFDINEDFIMNFVTYKDGFVSGKVHCGKVYSSIFESNGFYMAVDDADGKRYNVEPNKIISVEGISDIVRYINEKFLNSNECKARTLQKECENELSILIYLGRADGASINEKKRSVICNYLKNAGLNCSNEVLAIVARRINVDTNNFKKIVSSLSKTILSDQKKLLLDAANEIVGGKEKAKPFGLAGLQFIESKMKI